MNDFASDWSDQYQEMTNRNIGFISQEQQETLRKTKACVFGMGGIGGTAFEVLVRCGIGRFSIVDRDDFDPTNLNRQILATRETVGGLKIDIAEERARSINPEIEIEKFDHIDEENIADLLRDASVCVMGIDSLAPYVIASRYCRKHDIPLVESWAIPYGNVRVFTKDTPTLEEAYGLPTAGRRVSDIPEEEMQQLDLGARLTLAKIEGIPDYYPPEVVEKMKQGWFASFAPVVWLPAVMLALETVKVLLKWGEIAYAPDFKLYDPFQHRVPLVMT
jgi:molybdopterin-synthase adenylyltransferase